MIDRSFAAQLLEDIGPAGLRAVAAAFRADVSRLLAGLQQAHAADDTVAFARAAHGLAGAAGSIGATALERACRTAMVPGAPAARSALLAAIQACADSAEGDLQILLAALDVHGSQAT